VSNASRARKLFAELEPLMDHDPALARRVVDALRKINPETKSSNRRQKAVIDPFAIHRDDPESLRPTLETLNVEQLKDIVSHYAMDPRRLALKWKTSDRLVELIITVVEQRARKGDAFRTSG
jgi:hypothetical protein